MRGLTSIAKFSTIVYAAFLVSGCSATESDQEAPTQATVTNDATTDTTAGVAETMTAAMGASTTAPSVSILSPVSNKIYMLPAGSTGVVVILDVEVANAEVSDTGHHLRYYLDGEEMETVTTADSYMMLDVPMGRRHIAVRLVTDEGDVLEDTPSSLDGIYVRVEAECDGVGADGEGQCEDGLICSNQACGAAGSCKYGPVGSGCCDNDLECGYGEYCIDNACAECISDVDCVDDSTCTTDSCGADGQCVHENTEGCCTVDSDCDDGLYCTIEVCDGPSKTCIYEDNLLPGCCDDVGIPPDHADECAPPDLCTAYMCYKSHTGLQYCRFGPMIADCCTEDSMCNDGNPCTLDACDFESGLENGAGICHHEDDPALSDCCVHSADCDDSDPSTIDTCDNNTCLHVDDPGHCELPATSLMVINELMIDSGAIPDNTGEYIELYNASDEVVDLIGWKLETESGSHTIIADNVFGYNSTKVVPGGVYLLARTTNPAIDGFLKPHYIYDGFDVELKDPDTGLDGDWVLALRDGANVIVDSVVYNADWPIVPGHSMELTHPYKDNNDVANWVAAGQSANIAYNGSYSYAVNVKGSPKHPNTGAYQGIVDATCPVADELGLCGVGFCNPDNRCEEGMLEDCCTSNLHCKDFNPCTVSTCNNDTNTCSSPVYLDGCCAADSECVDDNPCNFDRCIGGICRYSPNVIPNCCTGPDHCDDSDACTIDACNTVVGECLTPEAVVLPAGQSCCNTVTDCDDGTAATNDFCEDNICSNPPAENFCLVTADCPPATDACKTIACNPVLNLCEYYEKPACCDEDLDCPAPESNPCLIGTCDTGSNQCAYADNPSCCMGDDADCDDGEPCTKDVCIGNTCHFPDIEVCCFEAADCSDGSPCTADACIDNECKNQALQACCNAGPPGDPLVQMQCGDLPEGSPTCGTWECTSSGTCEVHDPGNCCSNDFDCNDSSSCTADICAEDNTCRNLPTSGPGCCTVHSDCDPSEFCGIDGTCHDKKPDEEDCDGDVQCQSDQCLAGNSGTCSTDDVATLGTLDFAGVALGCIENCLSQSDVSTCTIGCIEAAAGVSLSCATCLQDVAPLVAENCSDSCLNPAGPTAACVPCATEVAGALFMSCTGLDSSGIGVCKPKLEPFNFCVEDNQCASGACVPLDLVDLGQSLAAFGACNSEASCGQAAIAALGFTDPAVLAATNGCALSQAGGSCNVCCMNNSSLGAPCDSDDTDQCSNGTWTCSSEALIQSIVSEFTGQPLTPESCVEYVQPTALFVTTTQSGFGTVVYSSLDGAHVQTLVAGIDPDAVVVDKKRGQMFWTHHDDTIMTAALNGTNSQVLYDPVAAPYGMAIDVSGEKLYWTSKAGNPRVMRCNLDGTGVETVVSGPCTNNQCRSLAYDTNAKRIYWAEGLEGGKLMSAGTTDEAIAALDNAQIVLGLSGRSSGLAVDAPNGKLYWTETGTEAAHNAVRSADLDGQNIATLFDGTDGLIEPGHIEVDVLGQRLYFTDRTGGKLYTATVDGGDLTALLDGLLEPRGIALNNRVACTISSGFIECGAETVTDLVEMCTGWDDNCDGQVDEGYEQLQEVCGVGQCIGGALECNVAGDGYTCATAPGGTQDKSSPETCDGIDNNCDGTADNGLGDAPFIASNTGVCEGTRQVCGAQDGWVDPDLSSIAGYEANELTCDGLDNDCDGETDESLDAPPADLSTGVCHTASKVCYGAGGWQEPNYFKITGYQLDESKCDGLDNNCNGEIDEDLTAGLADLQKGVCEGALETCAGFGGWQEPNYHDYTNAYEGSQEASCDGVDNNCSGIADDSFKIGQGCDPDGDECYNGIRVCSAAGNSFACDTDVEPFEACDGFDNDCDGEIDEGYSDQFGVACDGDDDDQCKNGVLTCLANGQLGCPESEENIEEVCNGEDDDCDGAIDEDDVCSAMCPVIMGEDPIVDCTILGDTSPAVWDGVAVEGQVAFLAFGTVDFVGTLERESPAAPVTWCITAEVNAALQYADFNITATFCKNDAMEFAGTFEGPITIDGATGNSTGTFTNASPWEVTANIESLPFNDCLSLQEVELYFHEFLPYVTTSGSVLMDLHFNEINGIALPALGEVGAAIEMDLAGEWDPTSDYELDVKQLFGTAFFPMPQSNTFTVQDMGGVLRRTASGGHEVEVTGLQERASIESWLGMVGVETSIRLTEDCGYGLTFSGSLDLGVFGWIEVSAAFDQTASTPMIGTINADFEINLLGLIELTNGTFEITVDEDKIHNFIWSADVLIIGLEFHVDGWFEISADGELTRSCFTIPQLPLGFGSLELLTVEDLTMCFPFECSDDGLAIGTCDGVKQQTNIVYVFDAAGEYESGSSMPVDDQQFEPYLDNFFAELGVPEGGPVEWEYVQPTYPGEPAIVQHKRLGYWVALQASLEHFERQLNPAIKLTTPFAPTAPGCYDGANDAGLFCDCDPGAIQYDADPTVAVGALHGACIQFSPIQCGAADECCNDGLTCHSGVCLQNPGSTWYGDYDGSDAAGVELGFSPDTPAKWPFYRDYFLGRNAVWFTKPLSERPYGSTGKYRNLAFGLHEAMKVLKKDELVYNSGGTNGQLNGTCLDVAGPTSADALDLRCPGLPGVDPTLHCVRTVCRDKATPGPWEAMEGAGAIVLVATGDEQCGEFPEYTADEARAAGIPVYVIGYDSQSDNIEQLSDIAVSGGHPETEMFPGQARYKQARTVEELEQALADVTGAATCNGVFTEYPGCSLTFAGRTTFLPSLLGTEAPVFDLDGFWVPGSDYALNVSLAPGTDWSVIPGIGPTVTELDGSLNYVSADDTTVLDVTATADEIALPGMSITNVEVGALVTDTGIWQYNLKGMADIVMIGEVQVEGNIEKLGPNEPIEGCLAGTMQAPLSLLGTVDIHNLHLSACFGGEGPVQIGFSGDLETGLFPDIVSVEGELTLSDPWELELTLHNVDFGIVNISLMKLQLNDGGNSFEVYAEFGIPGLNALLLTLQGFYNGGSDYSFTLNMQDGTEWTPLSFAPTLVFTDLTGTFSKGPNAEGVVSQVIEVAGVMADGWEIMPGVLLKPVTVTGRYTSTGTQAGWGFAICGTLEVGPLGAVEVCGSLNQDAPGMPIYGALTGTVANLDFLGLNFLVFTPLEISVEFADNAITDISLGGTMNLWPALSGMNWTMDFTGFYVPKINGDYDLTLNLPELNLGTLANLTDVSLNWASGAAQFNLNALTELSLGSVNSYDVSGDLGTNGDFTFGLALVPGQVWDALPQFGLSFSNISGEIARVDGEWSGFIQAGTSSVLQLVPGFTLQDVFVRVQYSVGQWQSIVVGGTTSITFGDISFSLTVQAAINADGSLTFLGTYDGNLEPFKTLIGPGVFVLDGLTVEMELGVEGELNLAVSGTAVLKVQGNAYSVAVVGGINTEDEAAYYLGGVIQQIAVPGLGDLPGIFFVITSETIDPFDIMGTPDDESDDIEAMKGLTLGTLVAPPVSLTADSDELLFLIYIDLDDPSNLRIEAQIPLDLTLIPAGSVFEQVGLESLVLKGLYIFIDVQGSNFQIGFGAVADFVPVDHALLTGNVEMFVDMASYSIGMSLWIEGQWREPFGLTNFIAQDPGMTVELKVGSPTPTALGASVDMLWVKDGNFPPIDQVIEPGGEVVQVGAGFYIKADPTPAGLCFPSGVCPVLPTIHARVEASNLTFPTDVLGLGIASLNATSSMFGGLIPEIPMPSIDLSPFDIDINELKIEANTHDLEFLGQDYEPGFEFLFDGDIFGVGCLFIGYLGSENLELFAQVEPFTLLGITFTGNPFEGVADLGDTGYIRTPHDSRFNSPTFTVEGHVRRNHWVGGDNAGVLVKKMDANNGFQVSVGDVNETTGKGRVFVTIRNGGETRIVQTKSQVVEPAVMTHIAAVFNNSGELGADAVGSAYPVAVYVEGRWQRMVEVEGPDIGPGDTTSSIYWGKGMGQIDDTRFWDELMGAQEIKGGARVLPNAAYGYESLIYRNEFNFDDRSESNEAFNYRLYETGTRLHGSYEAGASHTLGGDQSLMFKLTWPFFEPLNAGVWLRAGLDIDIPILSDFLDWSPKATVQLAMGGGEFSGNFYIDEFLLLPIPFLGNFILSGYGQNMYPGDFDDGVYGSFNLTYYEIAVTASVGFKGTGVDFDKTFAGAYFNYYCPEDKYPSCSPLVNQLEIGFDLDLLFDIGPLGEWGIVGHARLETEGPLLSIEGSLTIASQELLSGRLEIDDHHIYLETTFDLPTVFGFDFGKIEVSAELVYEPFRFCINGSLDLNVPFIDVSVSGTVGTCLGHNPYFLIDASASTGNILGFAVEELSVVVAMGNVPAEYDVEEGFQFVGRVKALIFTCEVTGMILANGQFEFTGSVDVNVAGIPLAGLEVVFNNSGIRCSAFVSVLGSSISISGEVRSDGWYSFTGTIDLNFMGMNLVSASVTLSSDGLWINIAIDFGIIAGHLYIRISNGSWEVDFSATVSIGGWTLAGASLSGTGTGATVNSVKICVILPDFGAGNIELCVTTGSLDFGFTASMDLNFSGFKLFSTAVTLNTSGLYLSGSIDVVGIFQVIVEGSVETNMSFSLSGGAAVSVFGLGADVTAIFSKGTGLLDFGLGGTMSVDVLGLTADGAFYVDTSFNFSFSASVTVGANLPKLPYPCIEIQCSNVCVWLPCVVGCAASLYGVCVVPALGLCTSCANVCLPIPTICQKELGWVGCTASIAFDNNGLIDPIGASCSLPLIGTIGVSLSASCGKICAHFSFFGASVNLCTPCLW
jgi:hypothetical protein